MLVRTLYDALSMSTYRWPYAPPPIVDGTDFAAEKIDHLNFRSSSLEYSTDVMGTIVVWLIVSIAPVLVVMATDGMIIFLDNVALKLIAHC